MDTISFLVYPTFSHLMATFGIADYFRSSGYKVVYLIPRNLLNLVSDEGFEAYEFNDLLFARDNEELSLPKKNFTGYLKALLSRIDMMIYHKRKKSLTDFYNRFKPEYFIFDSYLAVDLLLVYNCVNVAQTRFCFVNTMLSPSIFIDKPALNSSLNESQLSIIRFDYFFRSFRRIFRRVGVFIRYLGNDNLSLIRLAYKLSGLPKEHKLLKKRLFSVAISGIPEFILMPSEFDYLSNERRPEEIYVGSKIYLTRRSECLTFRDIQPKLYEIRRAGMKVILVSFGTLVTDKEGLRIIKPFLLKLINFISLRPEFALILPANLGKIVNVSGDNRIIQMDFLPQVLVLPYVDIFINHGGLNSIKESLFFNVPMLVYPFQDTDAKGNASKVSHREFGIIGNLKTETEILLSKKISCLLRDSKWVNNIKRFNLNTLYYDQKYFQTKLGAFFPTFRIQ